MTPQDVLKQYETRINLHQFDAVAPLIAADAVFWFNDGSFVGYEAIRAAFERTWAGLADETYWLTQLRWIAVGDVAASCIYQFNWNHGRGPGGFRHRSRNDRAPQGRGWLADRA